ncbi:hypothetical protein FKP32DRAFT_1606301 [Trametes sanguinea]|nr:hypothetical protein FKP32DRAFT_1606301 [Trametes sanguinea]
MARSCSYLASLVALLLCLTNALALNIAARAQPDSPPITLPTSQNGWNLGTVETVKWLTDGYNVTGQGSIIFGFVQTNGSVDFWIDQPLAEGFPLADGIVNVRCPSNVPVNERYVVALLPDLTNQSPPFMVIDGDNVVTTVETIPPATLLTTGNVPSATVTRSSVVGTIPPPSSSAATSSASNSPTQAASTSGGSQPTQTGSKTNGALYLGDGNAAAIVVLSLIAVVPGLLL